MRPEVGKTYITIAGHEVGPLEQWSNPAWPFKFSNSLYYNVDGVAHNYDDPKNSEDWNIVKEKIVFNKFNFGDKVKIVNGGFSVGATGTVIPPNSPQFPVWVKRDGASFTDCMGFYEKELELIEKIKPSPIKETVVTRRELVPGRYGVIELLSASPVSIRILAVKHWDIDTLRDTAGTLTIIANFLAEQELEKI